MLDRLTDRDRELRAVARRAAARERMRRWRDRQRRKVALYPIEIGIAELRLAERYAQLAEDEVEPRKIIAALERLFKRSLRALILLESGRRRFL
jgi:hypothetical protein